MNRTNPRCKVGIWLEMRNDSADFFIGRVQKSEERNLRADGTKKPSTT